jgi:hypothetical protein
MFIHLRLSKPRCCRLLLAAVLLPACSEKAETSEESRDASTEVQESDGLPPDLSLCDPANGSFSLVVDNPYFPLEVGMRHELEGLEAGTDPASFSVEVLDETEDVAGVTTRVVLKTSSAEGRLTAIARDFFAQASDGTVCHFGTSEDIYQDGGVVETEAWLHGEDGARAVVFMPAEPAVGDRFTASYRPPDEVEVSEITAVGVAAETPAGSFEDTLTILEEGPSIKKYARNIGEIYDDGIELIAR